jgi:hypothetical protein
MPLAKLLYSNKLIPRKYVGVDANKFDIPSMLLGKKIPVSIWAETDICALDPEDVGLNMERTTALDPPPLRGLNKNGDWEAGNNEAYELPNVLVCYEMLEHVEPAHARQALVKFQELTSDDCHYFISTPCYNGSAAQNHLNEFTYQSLGALLEDLDFKIEGVYGTFASIADYEAELSDVVVYDKDTGTVLSHNDISHVFAALRNYYDTNVLAVIFAPLFPAQSRNCLWHLTKATSKTAMQPRLFSNLVSVPTPWTSHKNWLQLSGFDHVHTDDCLTYDAYDPTITTVTCEKEGLWLGK